jgi:hypothetical protein
VVATGVVAVFRADGRGFVGPRWSYLAIEEAVARLGPEVPLLSNYPSAVDFLLNRPARDFSPATLEQALAGGGEVVVLYFEDARSYAPIHPQAIKGALSTAEYREQVLRGHAVTAVARERNAAVYRVRK